MAIDPTQNGISWLWQTIDEHDSAFARSLRERYRVQTRIYNAWCRKERSRKHLKEAERRLRLGMPRAGNYTVVHYKRKLEEHTAKLQELIDAAEGEET